MLWDSSKVILSKSKTESEKTIHCWKITFPPLSRPIWEIQNLRAATVGLLKAVKTGQLSNMGHDMSMWLVLV